MITLTSMKSYLGWQCKNSSDQCDFVPAFWSLADNVINSCLCLYLGKKKENAETFFPIFRGKDRKVHHEVLTFPSWHIHLYWLKPQATLLFTTAIITFIFMQRLYSRLRGTYLQLWHKSSLITNVLLLLWHVSYSPLWWLDHKWFMVLLLTFFLKEGCLFFDAFWIIVQIIRTLDKLPNNFYTNILWFVLAFSLILFSFPLLQALLGGLKSIKLPISHGLQSVPLRNKHLQSFAFISKSSRLLLQMNHQGIIS